MLTNFHRTAGITLVMSSYFVLTVSAQKDAPPLETVLKAAAEYVLEYSRRLQAVGAEEDYLQMDTGGGRVNLTRRVSSDVVMVGLDRGQIRMYRDAYAIDTKAIHQRTDRLLKLFTEPPGPPIGPLQYAQRFTDGSVPAYISPNLQALDSPLEPLVLLRQENQLRTTFKLDSVKTSGGVQVALLKFNENAAPSLVRSPVDVPVTGRVWIELPSGVVRQTEVIISNKELNLKASVTFALDKGTGLWLPKEGSQICDISAAGLGGSGTLNMRQSLETHFRYAKYQQVTIELERMR